MAHYLWVVLVALLAAGSGCLRSQDESGDTVQPGTSPPPEGWRLELFQDGLESPLYVTHAGDGSGRLFIVERGGRIHVWQDGSLLPEPFLDVSSVLVTGPGESEQGLLGLAFHPEYETNRLLFIYYTRGGPGSVDRGDVVIARYTTMSSDPNRVDPASARTLLVIDHETFTNHNGGQLAFGPDGYLYAGVGDGGLFGDPYDNAQNTFVLLGKLLRLDVDGGDPYAIPPDNPFSDGVGRGEIWAYGLRNPWRFSFDRGTGDLFIGDVGQNVWEEIDFQPADSAGGENYGWDVYEGNHDYEPGVAVGAVFPVAEYDHEDGCSVTGGYVYRGSQVPSLEGYYIFGDYCSGKLWSLRQQDGQWAMSEMAPTSHAISSFGEDEAGELYLVDFQGAVYRFAPGP